MTPTLPVDPKRCDVRIYQMKMPPNPPVQATAGSVAVGESVQYSCFGIIALCLTLFVQP